uniref:ParB/Sulfiredoxin domain-containing protein n=1 Tax=viral metagenome TaxID=1070528 RepID=A0A6C0B885_9ZZZZ
MFAYINIFKPEIHKINLDSVNYVVNAKGWGDGNISVNDVLQNPKKYKDDYDRINNANLKYPIIMDFKGNIFDGVHRYIKAKKLNKKTIKVYLFNNELLKNFIIDKNSNYNKKLEINEYIELFYKKFHSKLRL